MIKLVISDNEGTTTTVPLARDDISIGRKDGNTIRLTERNISREHCRLQRVNGSFVLRDLGSYNGVILNGQRITGESEVKPGDEIRIGDYTLLLQTEAQSLPPPQPEPVPKPSPVPRQPARLVVLTPPLAGAEFSLPERGEARLGRAPELDIAIDHRSVSREHCSILCDAGEVRIKDNDSVNGIIVNRQKVAEARLLSGDVVELGDVVLRFVGAGEHYVFDPEEARALVGGRRRGGKPWPLLAAVGGGGVLLLLFIARLGGGKHEAAPPPAQIAAEPAAVAAPLPKPAVVAATNAAVTPQVDRFPELVTACNDANKGGRFAEAVAHANAALKARPGAAEAMECLRVAQLNHEQEQILVRAKAALDAGDSDAALKELAGLLPESVVAQRPDVLTLVDKLGSERLERAKHLLKRQPDETAELARQLLALRLLPPALSAEANDLIARAEKGTKAEKARTREPAERRPIAEARPARPAASEKSPMEAASACLARGDNACVVRALNGRAQNPQELGLLIETYRAMGDSGQAFRNMALYVQRYPTAKRADTYRQMLERRGQ